MNRIKIIGFLVLIICMQSCEFNQSIKKDFVTGAFTKGDGITCMEFKMEVNGEIEDRNYFTYGEKVNFIFNNISGLTKENDVVYPGLSLCVVQNEKDTILEYADLLADIENGTDLSPLQLNAHFVAAFPYDQQDDYKVYVTIWDRKGEGTFNFELPFTMEEYDFLTIENNGLDYSNIYLWDQTDRLIIAEEEVSIDNNLVLILEGLDGFEIINGNVHPALSIELTDAHDNQILINENVLKAYVVEGIEYESFKSGQVPVSITFSPGEIFNPCSLKATLIDLNSDKRMDISCELEVK